MNQIFTWKKSAVLKSTKDLSFLILSDPKELKKHKGINPLCDFHWDGDIVKPIHYAAAKSKKDGIHWMLRSASSTLQQTHIANIKSCKGLAPLHFAAQCGNAEGTEALLEDGAEIDLQDNENQFTALHFACKHNHFSCANILLKNMADTSIADNQGDTPKMLAQKAKNKQLIRLLEKYEQQNDMTDFQSETKKQLEVHANQLAELQEHMSTVTLNSTGASSIRKKLPRSISALSLDGNCKL